MRRLFSVLPSLAFFVLLGGAAAVGYWFGTQRAPGGAAAAATTTYTCSMHPQVRQDGPGLCPVCHMELVPLDSVGGDDGPGVRIDPVVVQNMGVRVAPVSRAVLRRTIRAFGALREAQPRQRDIALKVSGFVEVLHADTVGMAIRRGDPLFDLYAAELVVAQAELIAARRSGNAELLAAARQKLLLWDVPAELVDTLEAMDTPQRTLTWRSPVDGVLVRRDVVEGAPAMADRPLLRIVDLSTLWLDAQVPESQIAAITAGQPATATFVARPGVLVQGSIVFVAPDLDARTRTGVVRVEVPNPDGALKPGMFARVQLDATAGPAVVVVPSEALLDTGLRQLAWIALGGGRFEPRVVEVGATGDGGLVEVRRGLEPGEHVVVSGQFLIDAESRLREGSRRFVENGLLDGGDRLPVGAGTQLDETTQAAVDAVLTAYLAVTTAFAADRDDADAWAAWQEAARALHETAPEDLRAETGALHRALSADTADLATRRAALISASGAAVALFRRARPSASFGGELHVFHCPMAPIDWVQVRTEIRNPYYGSEMLECGEETAALPLGAGGGQ
ncbi:MAG: efflux RND transporter periplasmic adaptor subunit [Planctomycetes bacterium]|nr:efflux RND transporter periplasmic adaptor subunit [Planctomycetota bacterium]